MQYYNDISKEVIKNSQIQAKWESDYERRRLAEFAYDLYNGLYHEYLNEKINQTISQQGDRSDLKKYADSDNIVKTIINDISLIFAQNPDIKILDSNGDENETKTKALKAILDDADINVTLTEINRLTNLFYDMTAVPVTRDGKIKIDLITPDKAFVDCNQLDPTEAETFYYQIDTLPDKRDQASRTDIYMACRKDGREPVVVQGKKILPYTGSDYDNMIDTIQYESNPATTFRNYKAIDSYWHKGINNLIEKAMVHDMRLTEFNSARGYQLPLLATIGLPADQEITVGRKSRVNVPPNYGGSNASIDYKVPDQKLTELGDQLDRNLNNIKLSYHMSKSIITGETATSGYQLWLSKAELLNWNNAQKIYYIEPLKKLIRNIITMSNTYSGFPNFGTDYKIDIRFAEQKFIETPEERIRRQNQELMTGTKNLVDIEIENSGGVLDREQALEIVKTRLQEKQELSGFNTPIFEVTEE